MLKNTSLPKGSRNIKLFQLDYPTRRKLLIAATILQIISLVTGGYGIAPIAGEMASSIFPTYGFYIGTAFAYGVAFLIEFFIYILIGFVVMVIPLQYMKEERTVFKVYAAFQFVGAVVLLGWCLWYSATLSRNSTGLQVESTALQTFDSSRFDDKEARERQRINNAYALKLDRLTQRRKNEEQSILDVKKSKLGVQATELRSIERKEQKYGPMRTARNNLNEARAAIEEAAAAELREVNVKYDLEEQTLEAAAAAEIKKAIAKIESNKSIAMSQSQTSFAAKEKLKALFASLIKFIAQFSVVGAAFCLCWVRMSEARTGQTVTAYVVPEKFQSRWYYELWVLVTLFPTRLIQNAVRKGLAKIPNLVPLKEVGAVAPVYGGPADGGGPVDTDIKKSVNVTNDNNVTIPDLSIKTEQLNFAPLADNAKSFTATIPEPKNSLKSKKVGKNGPLLTNKMPKGNQYSRVAENKKLVKERYLYLSQNGPILKSGKRKKVSARDISKVMDLEEKTIQKYLRELKSEAVI